MGSMTPVKQSYLERRREELSRNPAFVLYRTTLEKYVGTWLRAERHFGRWSNANLPLARDLMRVISRTRHGLVFTEDSERPRVGRVEPPGKRISYTHKALWDFLDLAQSPMKDAVQKCLRCERYYHNRWGHANKVYCSRQCATRDSAEGSTRRRRKRERQQKINKANRGLSRFAVLKNPPTDWKAWLGKQSGLTLKWITRATNRGDIYPPRLIGR